MANINNNLESLKQKMNDEDLLKIKNLEQSLGNHEMNFKHFLVWTQWDKILGRFDPDGNGVTLEDLEVGLNQMSLPLLKVATKNARKGQNLTAQPLYDDNIVVNLLLLTEISICEDMRYRATHAQTLMAKIDSKDLCDAKSGKCYYKKV